MDIYLWLSYRFVDMFPHADKIRTAQAQLDSLIQEGVANITRLIKEANSNIDGIYDGIFETKKIEAKTRTFMYFHYFCFQNKTSLQVTRRRENTQQVNVCHST